GDLGTMRQDLVRSVVEGLDRAEYVVPTTGVQSGGMVPKLVEDLLHLERGGQCLDQASGAHGTVWNAEPLLGTREDVVPESCLEMAFHLGQVKVRPRSSPDQLLRVVEEIESEVDETPAGRLAIDGDVHLFEVPATRANEQGRDLIIQLIQAPIWILERYRPTHGVV